MKAILAMIFVLAYVLVVIQHLVGSPDSQPVTTQAVKSPTKVGVYIPKQVVEAKVRQYFADVPILVEVARCESTFRHTEKNGLVLRGRKNPQDVGVMQINLTYHAKTLAKKKLDAHRLEDNLRYARYLYERHGTQPWQASAHCWG